MPYPPGKSSVNWAANNTYVSLKKDGVTSSHKAVVMEDKKKVRKVLPWVHIAISNAKRASLTTTT